MLSLFVIFELFLFKLTNTVVVSWPFTVFELLYFFSFCLNYIYFVSILFFVIVIDSAPPYQYTIT